MEQSEKPKWQREVEETIQKKLEEKLPADEVARLNKEMYGLMKLAREVGIPTGAAPILLKRMSKELRPLAAVYGGFQLGVAYERYQNANRA